MQKILICDDHKLNSDAFSIALSKEYEVMISYSASEALEILKEEDIDLALIDIKMPEMDGFKLVEKVNELGYNVKKAFLTQYDGPRNIKKALELGVNGYFLKNDDLHVLLQGIQTILDSGGVYLSKNVKKKIGKENIRQDFTETEEMYLKAIEEGNTTHEDIAKAVGSTSLGTCRRHIENIRLKIGAKNIADILFYLSNDNKYLQEREEI